jgi:hypothetical protein
MSPNAPRPLRVRRERMAHRIRSLLAGHDQHRPYASRSARERTGRASGDAGARPLMSTLSRNELERVELDLSIGRVLDDGLDRNL